MSALGVALAALIIASVALGLAVKANNRQSCTHGVSSIGPAILIDGKLVGAEPQPNTEACLP